MMLSSLCSSGFVMLIGSLMPSVLSCVNIAAAVLNSFGNSFGFYKSVSDLPLFWRGWQYINWVRYAFDGVERMTFNDTQLTQCVNGAIKDWETPWRCVAIMFIMAVLFRVLAYFGVKFTNRQVGLE
eukprot:Blabericola_migrator_1__12117@NODE_747_length_6663_cov_33_227259_g331_i2_p7_GENE_NODE_747_length_6663_cov_33_227259_g331_i2NODE_747_length_6663_cov_33_227259_g331_i2_p7_ORF_typecomplete_len126_score25_03ABC2_membrane/PF01061_24/4e08ABC2_membrane/PF01061_24/1_2e02ABC2_membrane_3/PF12698_7/8_4e06PDR_CDR/PF06422_12/0_0039ABC2_membrane_2/PF12679_7/0_0021AA_permease_2/PF13520_6/0_013PDR_assoc/PF08370_11/8_9e02PDR_assoc/PF08370_11/0_11_NODE_747_length_6663_cov_33_227259_g331_i247025079